MLNKTLLYYIYYMELNYEEIHIKIEIKFELFKIKLYTLLHITITIIDYN